MNARSILEAAKEVLGQGEQLLLSLDDVTYATKVPQAFGASLGAHYRHCLDHFSSVFDGLDLEEVDYDARKRDERIEVHREAALEKTRELLRRTTLLPDFRLDRFMWVRSKVSYLAVESPLAASTVGREFMFCIVHAIHHYALMGMMCGILRVPLPSGFGIAPSTLKHNQDSAKLAA